MFTFFIENHESFGSLTKINKHGIIFALLNGTNCRIVDYKYGKSGHYTFVLVQLKAILCRSVKEDSINAIFFGCYCQKFFCVMSGQHPTKQMKKGAETVVINVVGSPPKHPH